MEEKLFKTALEYINDYSINTYSITIHPGLCSGKRVLLQGHLEENQKVFGSLKFEYNEELNWHTHKSGEVEITLT